MTVRQDEGDETPAQKAAVLDIDTSFGTNSVQVSEGSHAGKPESCQRSILFQNAVRSHLEWLMQVARALQRDGRQPASGPDLRPVFRSAPFVAEGSGHPTGRRHAKILFVDEGNCCR